MDWIGVPGLDPSWVPPACYKEFVLNDPAAGPPRSLIIQPPSICLEISTNEYDEAKAGPRTEENLEIIQRYEAQIDLLKWLRKTCFNKLVIHTTDSALVKAREAGWTPDNLVLTIQTGGNILNTRWYFVDNQATEVWYKARYDCGLLRKDGRWFRIPKHMQKQPGDSPERIKQKYRDLDTIEEAESSTTDIVLLSFPLASEEEIRKCTEELLNLYLRRIYEKLWKTDKITPFHAIYMDEPFEQGDLHNPQFRAVVRGLYDAILRGRERRDPYYSGTGHEIYFGVGGYDSLTHDVADVAHLGDFIFDTKYRSDPYLGGPWPYIHDESHDQSRDWIYWRDYEPEMAKKMRGAWIHLWDDVYELDVLIPAAKSLGWHDLYIFPGPDETFWEVNYPGWRDACEAFRARVELFCKEIIDKNWTETTPTRYGYLYCKHYPACEQCSRDRREDWSHERPAGFPIIDRGPVRYLPGYGSEDFLKGVGGFLGESDL